MLFQEILRKHNVPFQTDGRYARSGWVQFHCPYCRGGLDANKPYMGYNTNGGYVNCWRCGRHKLAETIALLTRGTTAAARALIDKLEKRPGIKRTAVGRLTMPVGVAPLEAGHRKYLAARGFDPDALVRLWGVAGLGPFVPRLKWRVFIPIYYGGDVVSWTTRAIGDQVTLRYQSASPTEEILDHKGLLYGEDYCRDTILVHEGPTDPWAVGPGATCTFGTSYSPAQINRIARYPRRVVCFDNEPDAQRRARALCAQLALFAGETDNVILDAKDPAEAMLTAAGQQELNELRKAYLEC